MTGWLIALGIYILFAFIFSWAAVTVNGERSSSTPERVFAAFVCVIAFPVAFFVAGGHKKDFWQILFDKIRRN